MNYIATINIPKFQEDLITWFEREQRTLPWRENQDPYRVWVSEIMLQQTKVDTVIPYFQNFMKHFPTLEALANADEQEVLKAWEGLGYYSRARNLQSAVKEVVAHYDANVPDVPKELDRLKGVGPYTKGAILSIAFDQPEPAIDGNVMRVLSRILRIEEDIAKAKTRKTFETVVRELISHENPSAFNQGMMELGALICTPKSPSCLLCPIQGHCRAYHDGVEQTLPIKTKKTKKSSHTYFALVMEDDAGNFILEQRPEQGLLAQLWQFPMVDTKQVDPSHLSLFVEEKYQVQIKSIENLNPVKHIFSHLTWFLDVKHIHIEGKINLTERIRQLSKVEISKFPLPVSHQNIYKQL
ncbi:A/G-specific adenine glycosylase [Gracilibacillus boraciitolerans JCM 21714]|uniref:Adenine DNA glycosylase n=1 Tax=Gracilibacillus boraciitolerans JCM 21714 TaxID=1298598 RepID=W4VPN9_9BACI|nr:A/G-specific adenine glycosylase [Gracilibacillus boraciitolerans]GAE95131.1 A/G-specific adenine glycosylase [Gracilibacillus boraciitolerans JCM 21714]